MNETLQHNLSSLEELIEVQKNCISGDAIDYMHGMVNGMILAHSLIVNESPKYVTRPRRHYGRNIRHKLAKSKRNR